METQAPKTCSSRTIQIFQAALWCLAGGTLVGFAISVLWWDPVCQIPRRADSTSAPNHNTSLTQSRKPDEEECNPFQRKGFLHYNSTDPGDNTWRPYSPDCPPSNLFQRLKQDLHSRAEPFDESDQDEFAWLRNRTVVLIGDSIDRWVSALRTGCGDLQIKQQIKILLILLILSDTTTSTFATFCRGSPDRRRRIQSYRKTDPPGPITLM